MPTAKTLPQPTSVLTEIEINELQGAIASLNFSGNHTEPTDTGNLSSLWTLLNERVARATGTPTAITQAPQLQATASMAIPNPTAVTVPEGYGNSVAETYVIADTTLTTSPNIIEPEALASFTQSIPTVEAVVPAQALTIIEPETVAVLEPEIFKPSISDVLTPTLVTFAPVTTPTVTPLKEFLTANARRKTVPLVRLENTLRGDTFVLSAHSQGELLPHITLELTAPLGKTVQTASRTGEDSTDSGQLATLESVETGGEGKTSLKATVGYTKGSPDIVIEVSCVDGSDWQFHTQENGSDVSVEWEVTRQKGKAIVIAAAIGRAKGAEDVILELSRTLIMPTTEGAVIPQWRNLVELKQPMR